MTTLRIQSFRFTVVGLVSNAVLYLFYVFLTWAGLSPSIAVSIVFVTGAMQTFVFNRRWTFSEKGNSSTHAIKYLMVYLAAYILNILTLYIFVDQMNFPHQWVQAVGVIAIGAFLFLGQRYWVFPSSALQGSSEKQ